MSTCYAMVRGSTIRVTGLDDAGRVTDPTRYAVSKSVASVEVNEVIESQKNEVIRNPEEKGRISLQRSQQLIRHKVNVRFLRVDPGVLSLVAGVELVYRNGPGFGELPFGMVPFGVPDAPVIGFDSGRKVRAVGFALEVWSKLDASNHRPRPLGFDEVGFDDTGFDEPAPVAGCEAQRWGYTVFPYLRGGRVSGFTFANGLVSFDLTGAQTRRGSGWGVGPHDLEGPFKRLVTPVSRNTSYRQTIIEATPPAQMDGVQEAFDVLDNGTSADPMPDPLAPLAVDGGSVYTEPYSIDGGRA